MKLTPITKALEAIGRGEMVIVVDDENRENEGDLFIPAACMDVEKMNFMVNHGHGIICVPMTGSRLEELELPLMVDHCDNTETMGCQFTVSTDTAYVKDAGTSARDRVHTISLLAGSETKPTDLVRPGHVFPLRANDELLKGRQGHTEAAVVLSELAGFAPVGVICEVISEDGSMARGEVLEEFAMKHNLIIVSIVDLMAYEENR